MKKIRVAVTGMGVITPIATNINDFADGIFKGHVGTGPIESFNVEPYMVKNGGEVKSFSSEPYFEKLDPNVFDRSTHFAVAAAKMAIQDAELTGSVYEAKRTGVIMGTTMGNAQTIENNVEMQIARSNSKSLPSFKNYPCHTMTAAIACETGFKGPNMVIPTACAAGNYAIGYASEMIRHNKADCMICGGSDAISRCCYTMFARLGAISSDRCRPFDAGGHGMLVAEGAAVLVLENYDSAVRRGARIYAEIAGYGHSCDAYHITSPHPDGYGAIIAMNKALKNSNLNCEDIDYISAHGTGTKANDTSESYAIRKVFGNLVQDISVSSIKSLMGHTMGAAAAVEAVASVLAIHRSQLPVNANLLEQGEGMGLKIVTDPQAQKIDHVLSNSFAFGGNICAIIFNKPCEEEVA